MTSPSVGGWWCRKELPILQLLINEHRNIQEVEEVQRGPIFMMLVR